MTGTRATPGAAALDALLELSVIGAYTKIGFEVRRRVDHWDDDRGRNDLSGRTYVVTGASSGIGREVARTLVARGGAVRSASRSTERAAAAADTLRRAGRGGDGDVIIDVADLSCLADVRAYAELLRGELSRIDGLVHCAGDFFQTRTVTGDGIEANAAVYLVGPFVLTSMVEPLLRAAPDPRLVVVSSSGSYAAPLDVDRLEPGPRHYRPLAAYARAKRAQIALGHEWARRLGPEVRVHTMTPGWCDTSLVRRGLPRFRASLGPLLRTPAMGADTVTWLLASDGGADGHNRLWRDRRPRLEHRLPWTAVGDTRAEDERLWAWCEARSRPRSPS